MFESFVQVYEGILDLLLHYILFTFNKILTLEFQNRAGEQRPPW